MLHSKKKNHEKIISLLLLLTVSISCTDGFEEINTNKINQLLHKQLLPNVIFNIANSNVTNSYDFGDILAQYGGFMSTTN
jgi:hypothetical protein